MLEIFINGTKQKNIQVSILTSIPFKQHWNCSIQISLKIIIEWSKCILNVWMSGCILNEFSNWHSTFHGEKKDEWNSMRFDSVFPNSQTRSYFHFNASYDFSAFFLYLSLSLSLCLSKDIFIIISPKTSAFKLACFNSNSTIKLDLKETMWSKYILYAHNFALLSLDIIIGTSLDYA